MTFANTKQYRIKQVADLTGISRQTLISWERRHGIVQPARAGNGYRYYSQKDLELLTRIKRLLDSGQRIGDIARTLKAEGPSDEVETSGLEWIRDELGEALKSFDAHRVHTVSTRLSSVSFADRVDHIYLPLLIWIGDEWEAHRATVAEEHNVSAHCRTQMLGMLTVLDTGAGRRTLAAGFPGEHHENGLLAVAVKLALRGASVTYLGANLPTEDVVQAAEKTGATLVCQSIVMPIGVRSLRNHALKLRAALPDRALLAIGGSGVPAHVEPIEGVAFCSSLDELYAQLERKA